MIVRADAKFCPHCGMSIPVGAASAEPSLETGASQPPTSSGEASAQRLRSRNRLLLSIFIVLTIILLSVIGFLAWDNGWLGLGAKATETPTIPITPTPTDQALVEQTPSGTNSPTPEFSPEPTASLLPTEITPEQTETLLPTETPLPTIVIEEEFEGELQEIWSVWGTPVPEIVPGFTNYLDLDAAPRAAGITSDAIFSLTAETIIEFNAALKDSTPADILSVDWDPVEVIRQADSDRGQLYLDIGADRIVVSVGGQNTCSVPLPEANELSFSIRLENETISITLNEQELCPPSVVEFPPDEGRISFSGRGRLDKILVLQR